MFRTLRIYKNAFSGLSREIWLLSLVMLINRSGAMVIPFLTVYLTHELHFSMAQAGWVMSAFGAGSIAGAYIGGRFTDKYGYYLVQLWSLIVSGGMFFLLMWAESFIGFCVITFFTSLATDAFRPANLAAVGAYSRADNRTRSITLNRFAINLGWAVGPAVGGILAKGFGYGALFVVDGITCLIAAVVFWLTLSPKRLSISTHEKEEEEKDASPSYASPYQDYRFLLFLLLLLLVSISFMQILSAIPVFFKSEMGLDEDSIGLLMAMNGLLIVLIEMPLIYLLENRFKVLSLIAIGSLFLCIAYGLLFWGGSAYLAVAILYMAIITIGEMIIFPFTNTWALGRSNHSNRGRYMALYTMIFSISLIIAPNLGMQVAEAWGFPVLWVCMLGCALIAALGLFALERNQVHT